MRAIALLSKPTNRKHHGLFPPKANENSQRLKWSAIMPRTKGLEGVPRRRTPTSLGDEPAIPPAAGLGAPLPPVDVIPTAPQREPLPITAVHRRPASRLAASSSPPPRGPPGGALLPQRVSGQWSRILLRGAAYYLPRSLVASQGTDVGIRRGSSRLEAGGPPPPAAQRCWIPCTASCPCNQ